MCSFDRLAIVKAYYHYDVLWGPTEYGNRLYKIRFRPGACTTLEASDETTKEIYGNLVMRHNRLYIGYDRYKRRSPKAKSWPGTQNMPTGAWRWLESVGALEAVLMLTREA